MKTLRSILRPDFGDRKKKNAFQKEDRARQQSNRLRCAGVRDEVVHRLFDLMSPPQPLDMFDVQSVVERVRVVPVWLPVRPSRGLAGVAVIGIVRHEANVLGEWAFHDEPNDG